MHERRIASIRVALHEQHVTKVRVNGFLDEREIER